MSSDIAVTHSISLSRNWKLLLFGLIFSPLFILLGFWQLDREEEKKSIVARLENTNDSSIDTQELVNVFNPELQYQRIQRYGRFLKTNYLLDNRIMNGRVGYEVISPFIDSFGQAWLVNRGWVEAPRLRKDLPVITTPNNGKGLILSGRLVRPSINPMVRNLDVSEHWPKRIQQIDIASIQQDLSSDFAHWVINIDRDDDVALNTDWHYSIVSPERHRAYAIQWFAMAVTLVIAVFIACFRKTKIK